MATIKETKPATNLLNLSALSNIASSVAAAIPKATTNTPQKTPAITPATNLYGTETDDAVRNKYAGYYDQYAQTQQNLANQQIAAKNKQADKTQNQNYINYMLAQKAMPEQLARLGLSGGATETSIMRQNTNYQNTRANTENTRANDINAINQGLTTNLSNYKLQNDQAMNNELAQNASTRYQRQQEAKQLAENIRQFNQQMALEKAKLAETKKDNTYTKAVNVAKSYGTVKSVNAKIKALQKIPAKKRSYYQKSLLALLKARKSEIKGENARAKRDKNYSIAIKRAK